MRKHNNTLNTYNQKVYVIITVLLCLFFALFTTFCAGKIFAADDTESAKIERVDVYENKHPVDLEKVLEGNYAGNIKYEMLVEELDLEYTTRYRNNASLGSGVVQVLQEGRAGTKNVIVMKKYQDEVVISEEQVAENIIKAPVERIVEVGTGNGYTYKANEGDEVYVVATSVAVRLEANDASEKICTLNKGDSAKVLKIYGDWYFISNVEIKGFIPSNCVTTQNPNAEKVYLSGENSKKQVAALSFSMDLRKPSGMSLEQFKKIFANDPNDKNKVFENNAEYFYYVEQQYGVNGLFVAAVGVHESGWGTSKISLNKKNLFGYGAFDSNPYGGAYSFDTYSEGIDLIARVFVKYYLNSPGTVIYDGSKTSGKFYNGSTLSGVNSRYASDKNWANAVYKWMSYLNNKL